MDVLLELREKCPWDRKQTLLSLRPNTLEEAHELSQALLEGEDDKVMGELGDVLLHVLFYSLIEREEGRFDLHDVATHLREKLIYRHPHIYGHTQADTAEAVESNWEKLKRKEKDAGRSALSGVPPTLPSLIKALRIGQKAAGVGFDFSCGGQAWEKISEELSELCAAFRDREDGEALPSEEKRLLKEREQEELGDVLFSIVNVARHRHLDPDTALEGANLRFARRFARMEELAAEQGKALSLLSLQEQDALWDQAKKEGL